MRQSGEDEQNRQQSPYSFSSRELLVVSIGSGLVYLFFSIILYEFVHEDHLFDLFLQTGGLHWQLTAGAGFGLASAWTIILACYVRPVRSVLQDYPIMKVVANTRFSHADRIHISLVAGVGEELLFRGAIQPLIGVWWTSLLFIALHGYIRLDSLAHAWFALLMFALSVGLGFLFEWLGIVAAMTAHAVYDLVMLYAAKRFLLAN